MRSNILQRLLLSELHAGRDVLLQLGQAGVEQLLLLVGDLADRVNLLDTVLAELDAARGQLESYSGSEIEWANARSPLEAQTGNNPATHLLAKNSTPSFL